MAVELICFRINKFFNNIIIFIDYSKLTSKNKFEK